MTPSEPGILFDRDGVLNEIVIRGETVSSPRRLAEVTLLPMAAAAVRLAQEQGFVTAVVTNQPDLARGLLLPDESTAITDEISRVTHVGPTYTCPHDRADDCDCRKPKPGLLLSAINELGLDMTRSWIIGDRWVDIAAGRAAGLRTVLVRHARSWDPAGGLRPRAELAADHEATDVLSAVRLVVGSMA